MPMRLLAVADVYEALTSERPYRNAMSSPRHSRSCAATCLTASTARRPRRCRRWPMATGCQTTTPMRARGVLDGDGELVAGHDGPRERPT